MGKDKRAATPLSAMNRDSYSTDIAQGVNGGEA